MENMSYCRFENTSQDLEDCVEALAQIESFDDLSKSEKRFCEKMYEQCQTFMNLFEQIELMESED